jgi:hypothetical protein
MMTVIEFIYDRKYPVAIAADGGSMRFPPNVFEQVVSDYEKYKAENLPISPVIRCEHKNKKWIPQIAETYCPNCREIL